MADTLISDAKTTLSDIVNTMHDIRDSTNSSLFRFVKRATVISRVYIDNTLANEEIITPIMLNVMDLYVGLIMTALNLNSYIQGCTRVRDVLSTVATEDFKPVTNIHKELDKYFALKGAAAMPAMEDDAVKTAELSKTSSVQPLPVGRVVDVKMSGTDRDGNPSKGSNVQVLVQLHPMFVPPEVSAQFIAMNFKPSFSQRWLQMTSGEISFWSDFLLGNDLRRQKYNAMRKDKNGVLKDMEDRRSNAVSNLWLKLLSVEPDRQNIANTILIYESKNFKKACSNSGINFQNYSSRQKFFEATMSMIVISVDIMYSKISMYYNGINTSSELTFDQCKRNSKTEGVDIMTMMKQYAQGMAPKF